MLQLISFAIIYAIMIFIWSFVYLNRSHDRINQSFLWFLSVLLLWMVLCVSTRYSDASLFSLVVKTIYWFSMMNMSVFFLWFVYRLLARKPDGALRALIALNTLTLFSRYLFPMDYTDPTFWRLSHPVVAPMMSAIFSVPVVYALYLIIRQFRTTKDERQKAQLRLILWGSGLACAMSVVSEYLLPALFGINTQFYLMFYAILVYVVAIFVSIMKYRLMNIQSDYIIRKLFQNSGDGIIILHRNLKILSINIMAKEVLGDSRLDSGSRITDHIPDYDFETNYRHHEMTIRVGNDDRYLSMTQYPIDAQDRYAAKLLIITDITANKLSQMREKDILIGQTVVDPLTGLYNKRYFVEKYYEGARGPYADKLTIAFVDVDDFKFINDRYGHLVGDQVLKHIAACIKGIVGPHTDIIRFGGDEFLIILENAGIDDAYALSERLRRCVQELDFSEYGQDMTVSLSIGLFEGSNPINDLIVKADLAMYGSKRRGKNATTVFGGHSGEAAYRMRL